MYLEGEAYDLQARSARSVKFRKDLAERNDFWPATNFKNEDLAGIELLLKRLYADLKPQDIAEESYLHDIAYWTWDLRRWRRIRICLIEAATPSAMCWVLAVPSHNRLSYIGETHKIDVRKVINPPISEEGSKNYQRKCQKYLSG